MDARVVLIYLAGVSVRAVAIAGLAAVGLAVFRVRSAAGRHAVWTFAMAGILLLMALNPVLPELRIGIRRPARIAAANGVAPSPVLAYRPRPANPPRRWWKEIVLGAYAAVAAFFLAQLFLGCALAHRLARRGRKLSAGLYESGEISVPIALGVWSPRILLPVGWRDWDGAKFEAVVAHEQAHIDRADWLILLAAAFTRCLLWFHPLTWWLERHLAALAEQACDDRALIQTGDRTRYAQALLDMAQLVRSKQGRLTWQGIAMAKETQVKKRIDRILDDTRRLPGALSPARWIALFALSLPPVYLLTAVQLVPALAQTETNRYRAWLQEVSYIITAPEKAAFNNLQTDTERDRFVEQFWEQRKPFKEEYYRRIAYANDHYTSDVPGSRTDRGRIYITNGRPDEIESHPASTPPFEHWRYHNLEGAAGNTDFNFVDQTGSGGYHLTNQPPLSPAQMQTILENLRSYNENFPEVRQAPMTQPSAAGYEVLRARLQELRQRYNEDYPEVRETRNELAEALAREANALPVTPQRIRVGANVQAANLIGKVDPVYPPLAEQARIQGTVRFMVIIGKDGRFANIQLVSGHPLLVQAAKDALEQYVYKPTLLNGQPVEVVTQVDVPFTLQ